MSGHDIPWERVLLGNERLLWKGIPRAISIMFYMLTNIAVFAGMAFLSWTEIDDGKIGSSGRMFVTFWFCMICTFGFIFLLLLYIMGFYRIAYGVTNNRTLVLRSIGFSWVSRRDLDPDLSVQRGLIFESVTFSGAFRWGISPVRFLGIGDENLDCFKP